MGAVIITMSDSIYTVFIEIVDQSLLIDLCVSVATCLSIERKARNLANNADVGYADQESLIGF